MASDKFQTITGNLEKLVKPDYSFALSTNDGIDTALTDLLFQLIGDGLGITGAKVATDTSSTPATWSVTGTPGKWPIPGINQMPGTVSLKVTDGENDSDPLTYTVAADTTIAGAPLALSFAAKSSDASSTATLDIKSKAKGGLPIGSLLPEIPVEGLGDAIDAAKDLVELGKAALDRATIKVKKGGATGFSVDGGTIIGELKLGKLALQLTAAFKAGQLSSPDVTLDWPPPGVTDSVSANDVLTALDAAAVIPDELDLTLHSLRISYQHVAGQAQLNKNDTVRAVLVSPSDATVPDLRVTWSKGDDKAWRTVARAGWNSLALDQIPIIGSHLPGKLDPLQLFLLTRTMPLKDLQDLAGLKDFAGLENFGVPPDKVNGAQVTGGIYCAAVFDVSIEGVQLVHAPFNVPLYTFGNAPKTTTATAAAAAGKDKDKDSDKPKQADKTTELAVQKSVGPVHLDGIGFRYDSGALSILIDVSISVGGLTLELVGLRLSYDVKSHALGIGIDGLLMSFEEGGVEISGGLVHDTSSSSKDWAGEALIKVGDAFALSALTAFSDGEPKSMFVFAYDHQQLGGPPWLVITGIAAGFGYNRAFVVPAVDQVDSFPFIKLANDAAGGKPTPVNNTQDLRALLANIETFLSEANGSDFLTIGLTATSFGLVYSTALLTIVFGNSVEFVILGTSQISVPDDAPVAHAEVELVASIQPQAGIAAIDGLLAPGSYVLSQDCHLTGGFAYHMWFAGDHAGDFVLSFGGYGPWYNKPPHYPDVPRLGFVWRVSDEVMISGWNYFALTPSQIQAGGGLSVTLDADPLHAWCTIQADFSIQWKPFHYDIQISVDFGVSFRLHVLFCTIHISVDISADLHIWGPDFSGHADVHLWFVSFGLGFGGDAKQDPPAVSWDEFIGSLVVPPAPQTQSTPQAHAMAFRSLRSFAEGDPQPTVSTHQPVQITKVAGLTDQKDKTWMGDPAKTVVTIATTLPAAAASLNGGTVDPGQPITLHAKAIKDAPAIDPTLAVTITSKDQGDLQFWHAEAMVGQVSTALWGKETGTGTQQTPELVPGITGVQLTAIIPKPDDLPPIDQKILLVSDKAAIQVAWTPSKVPPTKTFDWDRQGPYATMKVGLIKAHLAGLVAQGYLAQDDVDAVDPSYITAGQPCFMTHPTLCPLGSEQYAEAA